MNRGFLLFVDEAGDEGLDRVRPAYPDGSSEYFVLCGILVRVATYPSLVQSFNRIKPLIGKAASDQIHFRDLDDEQKLIVATSLASMKFGLIAIVSNKQNM